jgi:hypothetical protein
VRLFVERFEERTVPTFITTNYTAGAGPSSVAAADFQGVGDGAVDFAVVNFYANTVSVFLNKHDGSGTFQPAVNYPAGAEPVDVVAGDLNGDGLADLVISDFGSDNLTILYDNPASPGTFLPGGTLATAGGPSDVRLADLNGDGFLDIITANSSDGTVGVILNNGDGTFAPPRAYAVGAGNGHPEALAIADFYGDGFPSVAVGDTGYESVDILRGNGDGTFQPSHRVANPGRVTGLAAGDLGNGNIDLVSANNVTGGVTVMLNDGAGNFTSANYAITPNQSPFRVAVRDINGDGNLDVVTDNITSSGPGTVSILYGNGDGTLQSPITVNSGGNAPSGVVIADVEGDAAVDGLNDLIIPNDSSGNVTVVTNTPVPVVVSTTLTGDFNNQTVSGGDVVFSDPIDSNTFVFDYDEFSLTDPHGNPVRVNSITPLDGSNMRFHVTFTPQSGLGTYTVTIGPDIYDPTDRYRMPAPFVSHFNITNNLLVNGGFETGTFNGWTQFGDTSFSGVDSSVHIPVNSGNYAAYFGSHGLGGISQTVTTMPGEMYQLSFWLSHPYSDSGTEFQVQIGGIIVDDQLNVGNFGYTDFTYSYTATGTSTTIQLGFKEPPENFYLDDVSLSPAGAASASGNAAGLASRASTTAVGNANSLVQDPDRGVVGTFGLAAAAQGEQSSAAAGQQAGSPAVRSEVGSDVVSKAGPVATSGVVTNATSYHILAAQVRSGDPFLADQLQDVL